MHKRHIAALAVALACFGCDDAETDGIRVGTYNAGLAPGYVPFSSERAPLTIDALSRQALDVACVQEVWMAEDVDTLIATTGARWPNRVVPAPQPASLPGPGPACTPDDLTVLSGCVATACAGVSSDQLAGCAIAQCQTELFGLPDACSTCLAASVGAPFEEIQTACTTTTGPQFAFEGSFGLALLSRLPLLDSDILVLDSTLNRRAVIYARVQGDQVEAHIFCTHLTAILEDIPYPGTGSWEAEQRAQIEALLAFIDEKTVAEDRVVLLGDLNTGPGFGDVAPAVEDNYNLFLTRFRNPYIEELETPLCTFCAANPLVPDTADSVIIDHVLVRNLDTDDTAARILTQEVQIDVDGTPTTVALSDHYGVRAAVIE